MLAGMSVGRSPQKIRDPKFAKPTIAIVGAGNLADTLAQSLKDAGYRFDQIVSRPKSASMRRARILAAEVGTSAVAIGKARIRAAVVWFCVPDGSIAKVATSLTRAADWRSRVALHSSGALTSDELANLRRSGAAVASVHPMMTFVRGSRPSLADVPFAIEGDPKAVRAAREIVKNLGGASYSIRAQDKAAYHAWGTFASPLLTALLAAAEEVAEAAGVDRKAARRRMLPMVKQTLANYAALGAAGGFSGPIIRGDIDTVKNHLEVLQRTPVALEVYRSLARAASDYLPGKKKAELEKILKSPPRIGSRNSLRRFPPISPRSQSK
jgi:predicted short-subunit dehydrogenase-like oxidoreductase (DUF2520 family)